MGTSAGKRRREQQKLEKARAKAERRASLKEAEPEDLSAGDPRNEAELIEDLRNLQQSFEAGEISSEQFEERRNFLQAEFGQLS